MMTRTMTAVLALAIASATAHAQAPPQGTAQAEPQETPRATLTFDGDVALWTVAIKPDQTAAFERVIERLREALVTSDDPRRRQQAEGWKVMKMAQPLPDGNVAYVHVISPVVANADYTVMQILYDELPDERQALYELYRGAFASNLALAVGDVAIDMSQALGAPAAGGDRTVIEGRPDAEGQ
jgi:hypothetical protein